MHSFAFLRRSPRVAPWALAGLAIASALVTPARAAALSHRWTGATNTSWNNTANWDSAAPYSGYPNNGGADIIVDAGTLDLTANKTLNLNNGSTSADRTVGTLIFGDTNATDTTTYNWTLGANGMTGSNPKLVLAVTSGTGVIQVNNGTATINPVLAGTAGLAKTGAGTLLLNNAANTLSGGLFLNAGALTFIDGALGANTITASGTATLTWSGSTADLSGRLALADGAILTLGLSTAVGDNTTFASALQVGPLGTGSVTKSNASTLTISGANTFTGGFKLNNGRLILIGGDNRLSAAGALTLGNGANFGVVQLGSASGASNQTVTSTVISGTGSASNAVVGGAAANSAFTINNSAAITAANAPTFGGSGTNENNLSLAKSGAGSLTLNKASTFAGDVSISGGSVTLNNNGALGAGTKTVFISGTQNAPSLQLSSASGLSLPASLSYVTSNDDPVAPAIVNTLGTNVIQGSIALASGGFGGGQSRILASDGSLALTGGIAPASTAASDRTLILDAAAGTTNVASGVLSDTGATKLAVTKEGAGTWSLIGANSSSGPVTVNGGRLNLTTAQSGTGALTTADGTTLGLTLVAAGQKLRPSSFTLGSSAGAALAFDLGSFSNPTVPVIQTGAFTVNGSNTVTVAGTGLSVGSFTLVQYTGAIGGSGFAGLPAGDLPSNAVPARVTASLVHDSANSRVLLNISKFDVPKWTGQTSNVWDINNGPDPTVGTGTVNWKEASSGTATRFLQSGSSVDSVIFDDTAGVPTNVVLGDALAPTGITVNASSNAYVFSGSGRLTGATSLLKQGTATLTLINTGGNDFTGTTTISAGKLQIGDGVTVGGGQLGSGPIVNNATLTLNRPDDFTVSNAFTGTGRLEKQGPNTVTLSGNNSAFTGSIVVSTGFLKLGSASALGDSSGDTLVEAGAELNVTGFAIAEPVKLHGGAVTNSSGTVATLNGPLALDGGGKATVLGGTLTVNGAISGTGGLQKTDVGTLALAGTSSFSGGLKVSAGSVIITADQSYTGGTSVTQGTVQIGATTGKNTTGNIGSGEVALAPATGTAAFNIFRADSSLIIGNKITSSGAGTNSVTIGIVGANSPSGVVTFTGANTFTGNVAINGGALKITNSSALGVGPKTVSIASNAGPSLILDGTGGDLTLAPEIGFTASSDGTIANAAANDGAIVSFAGRNTIQGKIALTNGGGGQGRVNVQNGTLTLRGLINADGATGARTLLLGGAGSGIVSGLVADGDASGSARAVSVTKDGAGTWSLTGANTFTGTVAVQAGTLKFSSADVPGATQALGAGTGAVTLGTATTGATLEYTGATAATLARPLTVTASGPGSTLNNSGGALLTISGTITKSGTRLTLAGGSFDVQAVIGGTAANSDLAVNGATVTLSRANTYNGATIVSEGSTLKNGIGNALPAATVLALGAVGGTTTNTYDLNGYNATIAGFASGLGGTQVITNGATGGVATLTVSGGGSFDGLIKDGTKATTGFTKTTGGTLTLTGAETYTGPTTVTGGTLVVAGGLNASSILNVTGGALELGGSDKLANAASLNLAGGSFRTGGFSEGDAGSNGLGALSLGASSVIDFGAGSGSSLLFAGLGAHTVGAQLTVANWSGTANSIGGATDDRLLLAGNADDFRNAFAQGEVSINGTFGYVALQYDLGHYEIAAVPEPSTASVFIGGVAALLGLSRARRFRI